MDTILNTKKISNESLQACIAACGHVDRSYQDRGNSFNPTSGLLKRNAGLIPVPEIGSRNAMIAKGSYEWLEEFHAGKRNFSLSNTSVKDLHRTLFKYSPRDEGTRGNYRMDLDEDMKLFFKETKNALDRQDRHPLFIISLFRVLFIDRMPFITGNALCAHLLSYALLINNNYPIISQVPLLALLNNPDSTISDDPLVFLPKTLYRLLKTFPADNPGSQAYLNSRQRSVLKCIESNAPVKISDIMCFMPDQNRNTIKKDLLLLKEKNLISSSGQGRGMVYQANNKQ